MPSVIITPLRLSHATHVTLAAKMFFFTVLMIVSHCWHCYFDDATYVFSVTMATLQLWSGGREVRLHSNLASDFKTANSPLS